MFKPEMNSYPPNTDAPSLSKEGVDVNNPTKPQEDTNPTFIGNASVENVGDRKSINRNEKGKGWVMRRDGTTDGFGMDSFCRVYLAADATITAGAPRKILFDTKTFDNLSEFSTSNNRFTAVRAGNYLVNSVVKIDPSAADVAYFLQIRVNGTIIASKALFAYTAAAFSLQVTDYLSLSVGDYVEIWVDSGEGGDVTAKGGTTLTYLNIHRLS